MGGGTFDSEGIATAAQHLGNTIFQYQQLQKQNALKAAQMNLEMTSSLDDTDPKRIQAVQAANSTFRKYMPGFVGFPTRSLPGEVTQAATPDQTVTAPRGVARAEGVPQQATIPGTPEQRGPSQDVMYDPSRPHRSLNMRAMADLMGAKIPEDVLARYGDYQASDIPAALWKRYLGPDQDALRQQAFSMIDKHDAKINAARDETDRNEMIRSAISERDAFTQQHPEFKGLFPQYEGMPAQYHAKDVAAQNKMDLVDWNTTRRELWGNLQEWIRKGAIGEDPGGLGFAQALQNYNGHIAAGKARFKGYENITGAAYMPGYQQAFAEAARKKGAADEGREGAGGLFGPYQVTNRYDKHGQLVSQRIIDVRTGVVRTPSDLQYAASQGDEFAAQVLGQPKKPALSLVDLEQEEKDITSWLDTHPANAPQAKPDEIQKQREQLARVRQQIAQIHAGTAEQQTSLPAPKIGQPSEGALSGQVPGLTPSSPPIDTRLDGNEGHGKAPKPEVTPRKITPEEYHKLRSRGFSDKEIKEAGLTLEP